MIDLLLLKLTTIKQATILKFAALAIAAPRWMGAFATGIGIEALSRYHWLADVEVYSGAAMAILEGFAMAFVLNKWRSLKPGSLSWWVLLFFASLLAVALPLIAAPYLLIEQTGKSVSDLFAGYYGLQVAWSLLVAGVPVLIIMAVGFADVDELEAVEAANEPAKETIAQPTETAVKKPAKAITKRQKSNSKSDKTNAKALKVLTDNPEISGSELGRIVGKSASRGRQLKTELLPIIEAGNEPVHLNGKSE